MRILFFLNLLLLALAKTVLGTTYEVGPGKAYEELGGVPWVGLTAGDTVLIHWRNTPYAAKIFIRAQGTPENPVVIKGLPGPDGQLPVITGKNATTDAQFVGYFDSLWTEHLALFLIYRGPDDGYYTYKPGNIVFENLALTGVRPENTFTDQFGQVRHYSDFGTAICAIVCDGLTVRNCHIYDNSQGIFTNTNGAEEAQISRNLLIEYNTFWSNGNSFDGRHHNIYAQAAGTVIQFNKIGRLVAGSTGASVKDRSSGTVIRYNWIESSARTLDLVEVEDGWQVLMQEPDYHDVYVYGNVLINDLTRHPFSSNMIHFGHDNSPDLAKRGTLYFYHNTVYIKGDTDDYWYVRLFDIYETGDDQPAATINLYNNIISKAGTTHLELMRDAGVLNFYANNWIQEGYTGLGYGATAQINYHARPIAGADPGFTDPDSGNFFLHDSAIVVDMAGRLPDQLLQKYPVDHQYAVAASAATRHQSGTGMDLGAFESDTENPEAPGIPQSLRSTARTPTSVSLQWDASSGNVTGYKLHRPDTVIELPDTTSFTDTGLAPATAYAYTLRAVNESRGLESGPSDTLYVTTANDLVSALPDNGKAEYVIYPNPAGEILELQMPEPVTGWLVILNTSGKQVACLPPPADKIVPVAGLPAGLYLLKVPVQSGIINIRFMKK